MKTDVIKVSSRIGKMNAALEQADKTAAYKGLTGKNALHLRLLTEEMIGMMHSITGETDGTFWIENQDSEYELHLRMRAFLTEEKKQMLISASSSGRNESARGLMGRIRDFFDWTCSDNPEPYVGPLFMPDMYEGSSSPMLDWEWSMRQYEQVLADRAKDDAAAAQEWDELEMSVVKRVADEVKVFIRNGNIELVIYKKMQ